MKITSLTSCTGCSACYSVCVKSAITMTENSEGFLYPRIDASKCIECGKCEKVCPILHTEQAHKPLNVYAAINPNEEIRRESSSGGIFTMLAESILDEGGVVFGARFNERWEVVHDYTETKDGLAPFRGSKYVQSRVGETYRQAKAFLQQGRKVMYTGTPCQIAGLKRYLEKEYDQLLTVDVVCHGVPSPLVWRDYLCDITANNLSQIASINFRDKSTGWKNYSVKISGKEGKDYVNESFRQNLFMQVFLKDLCLRPSCANCAAKSGKSCSDLTIADYWGMEDPDWDDNKGTSLALVHSSQGQQSMDACGVSKKQTSYEEAYRHNPSIERSVAENKYIAPFWSSFSSNGLKGVQPVLDKMKPSLIKRIYRKFRRSL